MTYSYNGRILRVDLSSGKTSVETPDDTFYRRYVGGVGLIGYHLLKELAPGIDPLGPENRLIFALGPVTGAPLGGSGRNSVGAKSPVTYAFGKTEVGGHFGAELKRAGYDAVIVQGKAAHPVYLWIHDGEAEIRDGRQLWGLHTRESQEKLHAELGDDRIRTAQIGPGGEKMVRFANIINDLRHSAGRTGMGAVMGSKNLKAIAVRGHSYPEMADPKYIHDMARWAAENAPKLVRGLHELGTSSNMAVFHARGNVPVRNFKDGWHPENDSVSSTNVRATIRTGMETCYACPVRCKKVVKVDTPWLVDPIYGGPEYETLAGFGSNLYIGDVKAVAKAHELCQRYSLDTISTSVVIGFAMECFENGLITTRDTGGLDLRFGNVEAMLKLVEMIGERRGIGDVLAEGSLRAAKAIGKGAMRFSMNVKGQEISLNDPRLNQGLGFGHAIVAHGADHMTAPHDTTVEKEGLALDSLKALGILEPMEASAINPRKAARWGYLYRWNEYLNSLVMCMFLPYSYEQVSNIVKALTGWNTTVWEAMKVGERAITLGRAFNVREGLTPEDDTLPDRFFTVPESGGLHDARIAINRSDFEAAKRAHYRLCSWDVDTGIPTPEKLEELEIGWVQDKLAEAVAREKTYR